MVDVGFSDDGQPQRKRPRVALACQACKTRKQKCDGCNPCSKCRSRHLECEYVIPQRAMPFGKNQYIKSLEHRVAELESLLSAQGMSEPSSGHWKVLSTSPGTSESVTQARSEHDIEDAVLDWQEGVDSVVSVLRSLSLDVTGRDDPRPSTALSHKSVIAPTVSSSGHPDDPIDFSDIPENVADRLLAGYKKHIATRWPVVHSVWVHRELHNKRHSLTDPHHLAILHLVYATGGRFLETTGEASNYYPKRHFYSALLHLDAILNCKDTRTVSVLMLMAIYCLRDSIGHGAWTYNQNLYASKSRESELRKRLFWACYAFDRQISIPMGRPFAISDRDIDVALPLEVDETITNDEPLQCPKPTSSTSLSSFIHIVKLRRIESSIQQSIYRVDKDFAVSDDIIDAFLAKLETWKTQIPTDAHRKRDLPDQPFDGYDYYMVFYYKTLRLLLYPQISKTPANPRFLKACASACAGLCRTYKRLHESLAVGYSTMSLQSVFMAGLTLAYCIWISPDDIFDISTNNGIHDCSIILFVIAERLQAAKKYRNAFEVIRQRLIDRVSEEQGWKPREAVVGLGEELGGLGEDGGFEYWQFERILTDMTGVDFGTGVGGIGEGDVMAALGEDFGELLPEYDAGVNNPVGMGWV
ncbi:hypothetical protein OQA88_6068 [Cercophora sp. LCS_1]